MLQLILFLAVYFFMAFGVDNLSHRNYLAGFVQLLASVGTAYLLALTFT